MYLNHSDWIRLNLKVVLFFISLITKDVDIKKRILSHLYFFF